jgi:GNAT superfamily N-acetyltransferase
MSSPAFTFSVRLAAPHDAQTLGALRTELFSELGRLSASGQPAFERAAADALANAIDRGDCCAWLAESAQGEPIGSVAMLMYPRLPSPESPALREGYLLNVYTVPEWRGHGIAAALVAAAIAKAGELGLGRIRLHATAAGQRVYTAAGFILRDDEMELRLP